MKKKNLIIIFSTLLVLVMPSVNAAMTNTNLFKGLENVFKIFFKLIMNVYIQYGLCFILFFILLYGAFSAGLKRAKAFGGDDGLSKEGKMICVALAMISDLGIFTLILKKGGPKATLVPIFDSIGSFGVLALGVILFLIMYYGFRNENDKKPCWAILLTGLTMMFIGSLVQNNDLTGLGSVLFVIGVICLLFTVFGGGFGKGKKDERPLGPGESEGKKTTDKDAPKGEMDPTKTTNVGFEVVDLEGFPLQNAEVIVIGRLNGKKKTFDFATGRDGRTGIQTLNAGPVNIRVRHSSKGWIPSFVFEGVHREQRDVFNRWRLSPWGRGQEVSATDFTLDSERDNTKIKLIVRTRRNWRPQILRIARIRDETGQERNHGVGEITYYER